MIRKKAAIESANGFWVRYYLESSRVDLAEVATAFRAAQNDLPAREFKLCSPPNSAQMQLETFISCKYDESLRAELLETFKSLNIVVR